MQSNAREQWVPRHVLVAGASGGVGREVVTLLRHREIVVTAMVRNDAARNALEGLGASVVIADALDAEAVMTALRTAAPIDAVISTIGGVSVEGTRSDFAGNRNLIDGYRETTGAGIRAHFILVSSVGSGTSAVALPARVREQLAAALGEKEQAEAHLIRSGLTYTVVRPGGLRSEPATGRGVVTRDPRVSGTIHRADVAQLVCDCLVSDAATDAVFSAVDRDHVRDDVTFETVALT